MIEGITHAYADGGVISTNPSADGGTWAIRFVREDKVIYQESGLVFPADASLPVITNNYTELEACLQALERMPDGWAGVLLTDSNVSRCRLVNAKPGMNGIPDVMQQRVAKVRRRLGRFTVVLLDGHPTREQLAKGTGKRGYPVSEHNVICDVMCGQQSKAFLERKNARLKTEQQQGNASGLPVDPLAPATQEASPAVK